MSQEHTIVVRFEYGIVPRYSAATEFQGGQVVAVNFDGNRLSVSDELEEALEGLLSSLSFDDEEGLFEHAEPVMKARAALAKANGTHGL